MRPVYPVRYCRQEESVGRLELLHSIWEILMSHVRSEVTALEKAKVRVAESPELAPTSTYTAKERAHC